MSSLRNTKRVCQSRLRAVSCCEEIEKFAHSRNKNLHQTPRSAESGPATNHVRRADLRQRCSSGVRSRPALRPRREGAPSPRLPSETHALLCRKFSRGIKFRINAAAGEEFRAAALFDHASVL